MEALFCSGVAGLKRRKIAPQEGVAEDAQQLERGGDFPLPKEKNSQHYPDYDCADGVPDGHEFRP